MHRLLMVLTILLLTTNSFGQTYVSGDVTGTWTCENSPYIVTGNINVVDSLTIEPCVIVQVDTGGLQIKVGSGDKFIARGTENEPIIFEPLIGENPGSWGVPYGGNENAGTGGGISLTNTGDDDTLEYCIISYATSGVYAYDSEPTINECTIFGNDENGVLLHYNHDAERAMVSHCSIYDNNVGVHFEGYDRYGPVSATCDIYRCGIYDNSNGVRVFSGTWWVSGTAYAKPRITNCTICNNYHGVRALANRGHADAFISNNTIAYSSKCGVINKGVCAHIDADDIDYNCFWGNDSSDFCDITLPPGFGENGPYQNVNGDSCDTNFNIYYDPLFIDTANADYCLQEDSKCIDAGDPSSPKDPDGTIADIGACYFAQGPIRGDANGDGVVNVADVVYLVNYLYRGGDPPIPMEAGDANCDGIVNVADVVYLVNYLYRGGDPPGCP